MTEAEKIDRGEQAAALLAHPLLKETFLLMNQYWFAEFSLIDPGDTDKLVRCRQMIEAARKFREIFDAFVTEGHNAAVASEHTYEEVV